MKQIVELNTDKTVKPDFDDDMITVRAKIADALEASKEAPFDATVVVLAYNKFDKTKDCIESVLKYTQNVNYNLVLIDNGSETNEIFEYFKSIDFENTYILRTTKNVENDAIFSFLDYGWISKNLVFVANDLVVTEHWLENMLAAVNADKSIGMITPMSTNSSNQQTPDITFSDMDDFQKKAAAFNKPDPAKWQQRLRLVTLGPMFTKECLLAIGYPLDCGFVHDFADDDVAFRTRRAGYKAVLAGDVLIHHNHDYSKMDDKDSARFQQSLEMGRRNFQRKYHGVDAWDDVVYVFPYIQNFIDAPPDKENTSILGIDTRAGQPILDVKNIIRKYGVFEPLVSAFTQDAKYYTDLMTFCSGRVECRDIEKLSSTFGSEEFDYIIIGNDINNYPDYMNVLNAAYSMLKKHGQLFITLKNVYSAYSLFQMLGYNANVAQNAVAVRLDSFVQEMRNSGFSRIDVLLYEGCRIAGDAYTLLQRIANTTQSSADARKAVVNNLMADRYWIRVVKLK